MTFAIADDEPLVRALLRSLILDATRETGDPAPLEARDGEELAALLRSGAADAAFVDIRMPRLDGLEAMRRLRAEGVSVPWYVLSSHSDFAYAKTALELGAAGYALKPPSPEEMRAALKVLREAVELKARSRREEFGREWSYFASGLSRKAPLPGAGSACVLGVLAADPAPPPEDADAEREALSLALSERAQRRRGLETCACAALPGTTRLALAVVYAADERGEGAAEARRFLNDAVPVAEALLLERRGRPGRALVLATGTADAGRPAGAEELRRGLDQLGKALDFRALLPAGALELGRLKELTAPFGPAELAAAEAAGSLADLAAAGAGGAEAKQAVDAFCGAYEEGRLSERAARALGRFMACALPSCADAPFDRGRLSGAVLGSRPVPAEGDAAAAVRAYLERHFREDVGVAGAARLFGLSPNYLSALFKKRYGRSFVDFLTELRLEEARLLLRAGGRVGETAWAVGYGNERHFARLYRERYGLAPAQERRGRESPEEPEKS